MTHDDLSFWRLFAGGTLLTIGLLGILQSPNRVQVMGVLVIGIALGFVAALYWED